MLIANTELRCNFKRIPEPHNNRCATGERSAFSTHYPSIPLDDYSPGIDVQNRGNKKERYHLREPGSGGRAFLRAMWSREAKGSHQGIDVTFNRRARILTGRCSGRGFNSHRGPLSNLKQINIPGLSGDRPSGSFLIVRDLVDTEYSGEQECSPSRRATRDWESAHSCAPCGRVRRRFPIKASM